MARLTWQNVAAPDLDIRGMAIASSTINNAFDQVVGGLREREARLRQEATDQAIAQQLAFEDPNQMGTVDPASFGKRVNAKDVLAARQAHRANLIQTAKANEDLQNSQAMAAFGKDYLPMIEAAMGGDAKALAATKQAHADNPLFSRFLAQVSPELGRFLDTGNDNRLQADQFAWGQKQDGIRNRFEQQRIGIQQQELSLRKQEAEDRRAEKTQQDRLLGLGDTLAAKYEHLPLAEAQTMINRDLVNMDVQPSLRGKILAVATETHTAKTTPITAEMQRSGAAGLIGQMVGMRDRATQYESVARERILAENPAMWVLQRAKTKQYANATRDDVMKRIEESHWDVYQGGPMADRLMKDYNLQPSEALALLDQVGDQGITTGFGIGQINSRKLAQQIVDLRNTVGGEDGQKADIERSTRQYRSYIKQLDGLEADIRASVANKGYVDPKLILAYRKAAEKINGLDPARLVPQNK